MGIPDLDPVNGEFRDVSPLWKDTPYSPSWWVNSTISRIPEQSVGWLAAQGWQITGTYEENNITYYTMTRQSMQSWFILQKLLVEFIDAYNEGRKHNSFRYNDLLLNWNRSLVHSRGTLDTIADVHDAHVTIYFDQIDSLTSEVETALDAALEDVTDAATAAESEIAKYLVKVGLFETDYTPHKDTSEGFLVGLGTTELARINEQFDNLFSRERQALVKRGLYSAAIINNVETRIERERNEAIAKLNDALAREKLENEHTLYQQLVAVRQATMAGKSGYVGLMHQNGGFLSDNRHRLALAVMQAKVEKANARLGIRDREEKLMAYQLDTRNNLAIGLYGMVERREDSYPSMESLSRLIAGMGDAGGGWLQP